MTQENYFLRKIPEDMRPWECNVNGVKYVYPAGTEQNVPAEVAALIDAYWEKQEADYPETGISFNDLRDRPFGEDTEVLFDQRVEFEKYSNTNIYHAGPFKPGNMFEIENGETVVVVFEDKAYKTSAIANLYAAGIGNANLSTDCNAPGLPFFVQINLSFDEAIFDVYSYGPITTNIKVERMVANTIDPRYLPQGSVGYEESSVLFKASDYYVQEEPEVVPEFDFNVENGDTVIVTWGGEKYVCDVGNIGDGAGAFFGNMALGGEAIDTGEPFLFATQKGVGGALYSSQPGQTHSFRIEKSVIHTIDPKFIPAGVGGGVVIVQDSAMASGVAVVDGDATATMNAAEIAEAVQAGKTVYFLTLAELLLPLAQVHLYHELVSGAMAVIEQPNPYVQFGTMNEDGSYMCVKVWPDGSYTELYSE